jgi:hypothetical protein
MPRWFVRNISSLTPLRCCLHRGWAANSTQMPNGPLTGTQKLGQKRVAFQPSGW